MGAGDNRPDADTVEPAIISNRLGESLAGVIDVALRSARVDSEADPGTLIAGFHAVHRQVFAIDDPNPDAAVMDSADSPMRQSWRCARVP